MTIADGWKSAASSPFDLDGQVSVVTGGGRGIGRAIVEALLAHGAQVVVAGRSAATLEALADELNAGTRLATCVADISSENQVEQLYAFARQRFGRVDTLVNNAGVNPYFRKAVDTPFEEWRQLINVNLSGTFLGCRVFGAAMLSQGSGSIINITSIGAHVGLERSAAYCAAKAGVEGLTRSLAVEWAKSGVRVNCIAPGYVETDLTAGLQSNSGLKAHLIDSTPIGRLAYAEEISGAAVFLASRASTYVTGQSIVVDGGWTAK